MSSGSSVRHESRAPSILVVDDDRRVVELLHIALTAHGFRVLSASDGDEALRLAHLERPDLVVLDVRLPKRSGLEVCERLRQDSEDPQVPIIMVSAAVETDARLQGLARGADDYLGKPFSPKELIARIKRQLARAADARDARRRGQDAERELSHARDEAQRSHQELQREQRLRALAVGATRRLHDALDREVLAARLLVLARAQLEVGAVALLAPEREGGTLRPIAASGAGLERAAGIAVAASGELAALLQGLGRPVRRQDLEASPELRDELPALIVSGFSLLAPLRGAEGLEGILLADERVDGRESGRAALDGLAALCDVAAPAMLNARRCRAHAEAILDGWTLLADRAAAETARRAAAEAADLARRASRDAFLPAHAATLVARAVPLAPWIADDAGRDLLRAAADRDPSGRLLALLRLVETAESEHAPTLEDDPLERRAVSLLRASLAFARARAGGATPGRALHVAVARALAGGDDALAAALRALGRPERAPAD